MSGRLALHAGLSGPIITAGPGGGTPTEWVSLSARDAYGVWPGGNPNHSTYNGAQTAIGGAAIKFRTAFLGSAKDTTWQPKLDSLNTLTNTANTTSMFNYLTDVTAEVACHLLLQGQTFAQALPGGSGNAAFNTFLDTFATTIYTRGFCARRADGRPILLICFGRECNGTWFAHCFGRDPVKAAQFAQLYNYAIARIRTKINALGGDGSTVEFTWNFNAARRPGSVDGTYTGRDLMFLARPLTIHEDPLGGINQVEADAYDFSGAYVGRTAAQKPAQRLSVVRERNGQSTTGGFSTSGQGFDLVREIAVTYGIKAGIGETGNCYSEQGGAGKPGAGIPGANNGAEGGDDNPGWQQNIYDIASQWAADGILAQVMHYYDDVFETGLFHLLPPGSHFDFSDTWAHHLELYAA